MRRFPALFLTIIWIVGLLAARVPAVTEDEKREQFLSAREEMKTVPKPTVTPKPKPKPKPAVRKKGVTKKKPAHKAEEEATPRPKPSHSPTPKPKREEEEESTPTPKPSRSPSATPSVTPSRTATPAPSATPAESPSVSGTAGPVPSAPITVEKSGLEQEEGYVEPEPEPKRWWFFGGGPKYKYLTKAIRDEIDHANVKKKRWRYIVVHNSGSRQGNAKIFDYYHRYVRKMPNGLAYHFVIGNGRSSGDGQIEIGDRWKRQINGGHVHSDYLNNIAIGICLVGDFNRDLPTQAQLDALDELIKYLRGRVGKFEGKPSTVVPHKRINPPRWPTDCPGDRFPYVWFRRFD